MASLRLHWSPSNTTIYNNHRNHNKTTLTLPKTPHTNPKSISLSRSILSTKRTNLFVLQSSATTRNPVPDSKNEEEYSTTRLLAQNVPWTSTAEDIRGLFEKFGTVLDVELSMHNKTRNRGLAFVTMGSPEEAVAALNNLDSYVFEDRALKMNYAKLKRKKPLPPANMPKPTFNLFVDNLHYEASSEDLYEFSRTEGADVVSAEVVFNDNPERSSSGYGFVALKTKKGADEVLTTFKGKVFKGRPLRVARSKQFVRSKPKEGVKSDENSAGSNIAEEQAETAAEN